MKNVLLTDHYPVVSKVHAGKNGTLTFIKGKKNTPAESVRPTIEIEVERLNRLAGQPPFCCTHRVSKVLL